MREARRGGQGTGDRDQGSGVRGQGFSLIVRSPRLKIPPPSFPKGGKSPPLKKGDLGGGFSESAKEVGPKNEDRKQKTENRKPSVVISEPLAEAFHYKEGDTLTLPTPSGPQELRIAGVFYDYRTDGPSVWMDISNFRRFWRDNHLNVVRLYLKDPAKVPQMQARLQEKYGSRYRLLALSHRELRQGILRIFDETFALTYALEGVAVVVAIFGIITTFLVLIMERERELALLQAVGASRGQILGMALTESGLASLLSFILGAASELRPYRYCSSRLSQQAGLRLDHSTPLGAGHLLAEPVIGDDPGPGRRGLPGLAGHPAASGGDFEGG